MTTMPKSRFWPGFSAFSLVFALLAGCGKDAPRPIAPPSEPGAAPTGNAPAANADDDEEDDEDRAAAVPAPKGATPGDVLPPLPKLPARLYDGGVTASAMPEISCEELAPEKGFGLAKKIDVIAVGKTKADGDQTLELCQFNKWEQRTDAELAARTGRRHHFVAAFPGTTVASWTTKEITRGQLGLHEGGGTGLGAGWATVIATGVPQWPAIAVVSARFFGGPLSEEVHYLRRGRVLLQSRGRWTWAPLTERAFSTLDVGHLQKQCESASGEAGDQCANAAERVAKALDAEKDRVKLRAARLAGKADPGSKPSKRRKKKASSDNPLTYDDDPDPHAGWLRDGRKALKDGDEKLAIRNALRVLVACGESSKEAHELIVEAQKQAKQERPRVQPPGKHPPLCEPLPDKPPPSDRKR